MAKERRKFDEDFKAKAVARVIDGGEIPAAVIQDLELTDSAYRGWLKKAGYKGGRGGKANGTTKPTGTRKIKRKAVALDDDGDPPDIVTEIVGEVAEMVGAAFTEALVKAYNAGQVAGRLSFMEKIGQLMGPS